uniref:Uncharacterized protein n=1 Tax=Arundo donax TaxID=35708 RepID=A0A0A9GP43_ARUDO
MANGHAIVGRSNCLLQWTQTTPSRSLLF